MSADEFDVSDAQATLITCVHAAKHASSMASRLRRLLQLCDLRLVFDGNESFRLALACRRCLTVCATGLRSCVRLTEQKCPDFSNAKG